VDAKTTSAWHLKVLGKSIRDARLAAGISTRQIAARLEMDRSNYLRIEGGRSNVTYETLWRIAEGLGMKLVVEIRSEPSPRLGRRSEPA
jgi:transcriptional regulator with XRE-family HTH domain